MPDAVVIGSGPNGLVAANMLADEGWEVVVLEAQSRPGGAVRSSELIEPGYVNDEFSAFYPLGAGSPVIQALELEKYGLEWCRSTYVVANPTLSGLCPILSTDIDETIASFDKAEDAEAWHQMSRLWDRVGSTVVDALFSPMPPVRAGLKMAQLLSPSDLRDFARFAVVPVKRMGEELFAGEAPRLLLTGLSLHADFFPESSASGFFGWLLAMLGQNVGFPVPKGGAGALTDALVNRLRHLGGEVMCNKSVASIQVRRGRAHGVLLEDGTEIGADRAVVADVDAVKLYRSLIPRDDVPSSVLTQIRSFHRDFATVKVDWNLDSPIPWSCEGARQAGTVHLNESVVDLTMQAAQVSAGMTPDNPLVLMGQQSMTDPSRQPAGKETAWAYTHIPFSSASETDRVVDSIEQRVEALAPGFASHVRGRYIASPANIESRDVNLVGGSLGGGTAQLHQQLIFRPPASWGRPETPVRGLYLASSSVHPGPGVHGACGSNAARTALLHWNHKRAFSMLRVVAKPFRREREGYVPKPRLEPEES